MFRGYICIFGVIVGVYLGATFLLVDAVAASPQRPCHWHHISSTNRSLHARVGFYGDLRPGNMHYADERCFEAGTKQISSNNVFTAVVYI
jgi:hypothetical protein